MVIDSGVWFGVKRAGAGVLFSHAFSGELQTVSVVDEAVEDGVAERWIAEHRRVLQPSTGSFLTSRSRIGGTPYSAIGLRF